MKDGLHYTRLEQTRGGNALYKYSYKSGEQVAELVNSSMLGNHTIDAYSFSMDESRILIATNQESIYRHSTKANYLLYNIKSKEFSQLGDEKEGKIRLAEYSPDGTKVAYVKNNDLYYVDLNSDEVTRVTEDGKYNEVINGATDWVYEEEFGFDKGFYWSKDGGYLAYYRFDETEVKEFQMAMYGNLYPDQYSFKYPKAGEVNSHVSIHVHVLKEGSSKQVSLGTDEHYVPRIKWTAVEGVLCITRMNRLQNHLELLTVDARSVRGPNILPKVIFDEKSKTYIEISDDLVFLRDNRQFLMTSDRDGYNHIYLFNAQGKVLDQLTQGEYDVIEFSGLNEGRKKIYYTSSEESVTEKNVYSIDLSGTGQRRLSPEDGHNDVVFSEGFKYYTIYHSTANTPSDIRLYDERGKEVRMLINNAELISTIEEYGFQPKEFFTFETERGDELNGWQILPPDFDSQKKYPVLLAIYGGPGHNTVTNSFGGSNYYWHQMLSQKGYIIMSVDPRGTYYRGRDFKNSTYKELGKLETEDMISTAKYLATIDYVDSERIGMQGWSYGGYLTSLCMTKGADYFKAGIAVAPVTNWRFYDTIYTERFMQTPSENASGYDDNSPINHVEKLKGPYLLVHGSADDNVHYQNTMEMVDALVAANKEFDLFIYPNKNHGIYGGTTRLHLYTKMTNFILENL